MDKERHKLINELMKKMPYPYKWFDKLPTDQLIAIQLSNKEPRRKKHAAVLRETSNPDDIIGPHRYYDSENGQWLVKTDGHGWEPEEN